MDHECICEKQEGVDNFTSGQWQLIDEVIQKFKDKPGALIPVLEEIQGITGYLPESVQRTGCFRFELAAEPGLWGDHLLFFLYHEAQGQAPDSSLLRNSLPRARRKTEYGTSDSSFECETRGVHGGP